MLHGCTQDPDDFAAGTAMNEAALMRGFFVLYPAQSMQINPQRCWNWFKHNHQCRGRGEPALIAGMARETMIRHAIDGERIYVAGLSVGGAMAAILGDAYPDVFAAVGVHSGRRPRGRRTLDRARRGACVVGRPLRRLVHRRPRTRCQRRNGPVLPGASAPQGALSGLPGRRTPYRASLQFVVRYRSAPTLLLRRASAHPSAAAASSRPVALAITSSQSPVRVEVSDCSHSMAML